MQADTVANPPSISRDALLEFQLTKESISEKSSKEYGLAISKKIFGQLTSGLGGYLFGRNLQFQENRNYAHGMIDVQAMFQDRLQMNGKNNYIKLIWQTLQIVNRIVSGLVGRWMERGEKIQVKAIDDLSQTKKQQEYEQIEYLLFDRQRTAKLQQQSGVQMMPDDSIPADKEELLLWKQKYLRLPEEIEQETACNEVLSSNGCYDVLKEKWLHDSAEVLLLCSYVWMDTDGIIHVEWVEPENAFSSATKFPDFRDTTYRGQMPSRKISEIRKMWGKEFNPKNPYALSEEDLWQKVVPKCKEWQTTSNLTWTEQWTNPTWLRPYDEWNIRCMEFEIKTVDSDPYTVTKTVFGSTYTDKGYPVNKKGERKAKPSENQQVLLDTHWNIYEGCYLPDCDLLVKWKVKENMIRPQDPKEIGNCEFSYSFFMPQVYKMRNLPLPQKIKAAVDGMIFSLLKIQQDLAASVPPGWAIDETALQNIDYGLGEAGNKDIDHAKLFWQTGKMFYKGIDAEGNRIPIPIQELQNAGFAAHIQAFITTYQFWYQTLRDELGEDPNLISSALQPRVTSDNVEVSQASGEHATDYMYRAYAELMKITSKKVSCLLKDSIAYGAKAYRNIVKTDDISYLVYSTDIQFLPTEQQVQQFDAMLQNAINSNPELTMFLNQLQAMEMAKDDVKMAWTYYNQCLKKWQLYKQQETQQNQQATFQAQQQSAITAEKEKRQTMKDEVQMKGDIESMISKEKQKEIILQGIFGVYQKGLPIPSELKPLENEILHNVAMPLFAENVANSVALSQFQVEPDNDEQQGQEQQDDQSQGQQQLQQQPQMQAQ